MNMTFPTYYINDDNDGHHHVHANGKHSDDNYFFPRFRAQRQCSVSSPIYWTGIQYSVIFATEFVQICQYIWQYLLISVPIHANIFSNWQHRYVLKTYHIFVMFPLARYLANFFSKQKRLKLPQNSFCFSLTNMY